MASLLANGQADELEDLMLREAIRRSLLDSQQDRNGTDGLGKMTGVRCRLYFVYFGQRKRNSRTA